jgi:hypothetical protein
LILTEVSQSGTVQRLNSRLGGSDPIAALSDIFRLLVSFGVAEKDAPKIFPNELGKFCLRKDLQNGKRIPPDLKEIQRQLSDDNDIRSELLDPRLTVPGMTDMDLRTFCRQIDDCVKEVYAARTEPNPALQKPLGELCFKWAGQRDPPGAGPLLFPFLTKKRHSIFFVMVLPDEKRDFLFTLAGQSVDSLRDLVNHLPPPGQAASRPEAGGAAPTPEAE